VSLRKSAEAPVVPATVAPFKRRGSILVTLVAVLTAVGLAPLAFVAWKLIVYNREALTTEQQVYQLLLASSIAREVDSRVEGLRAQFLGVSQALAPALGNPAARPEDAGKLLEDVTDERLLCVHFAGIGGESLTSCSAALDPRSVAQPIREGFRKSIESLAGGGEGRADSLWVSQPVLLPGKRPRAALVLSAPVVVSGRLRGVLSAVVDIQSAWDAVASGNSTGHTIFALDAAGRVIASNDAKAIAPGTTLPQSALVLAFRAADSRYPVTMPFTGEDGGTPREYLGSYLRTHEGWGVFVQIEKEKIFAPVRDMVKTTRNWALVALALALVAALTLAGTLSTPIQRLASASREFAKGNLKARVSVRSRNEIGELADTFNLMASEIEDFIRRLTQAAQENRELFLGTINALTAAIDAKDPYTKGHSERVNTYAVAIARVMGLDEEQIWEIHVASRLHDVGKIAVDDAVLRKPGILDPEEMALMKTHPVRGAAIMESIHQMRNMIPGLRNHHERWAGGGYPDGLQGDEIPLMARIISVADTFDAMTTNRPYQKAMSPELARRRINELQGAVLDARVVEAFNRAWDEGRFPLAERVDEIEVAVSA